MSLWHLLQKMICGFKWSPCSISMLIAFYTKDGFWWSNMHDHPAASFLMTIYTKDDLWYNITTLQHLSLWHLLQKMICGLKWSPWSICPYDNLYKRWFVVWHDHPETSVLMSFFTKDVCGLTWSPYSIFPDNILYKR